jgi:hypothetical protein
VATFNNVIINGSLAAVTFSKGEISSVGGAIFVRPSSRIVEVKVNASGLTEITIESAEDFNIDDVCRIGSEYYTIKSKSNKTLIFEKAIAEAIAGKTIVNMGQNQSIGIGINGSNSTLFGLLPNSITVNEFNGINTFVPKVILGKLPKEKWNLNQSSYGLYAENAYLTGSLTTINKNTYSGIGTVEYNGSPTTVGMGDRFPGAKGKI